MEVESSFELVNLVSTPSDSGFPFPSPSSDLPPWNPIQPSHMNIDHPRSAVAVAVQSWKSPDMSSTHTDLELVDSLHSVIRPSDLPEECQNKIVAQSYVPKDVASNPAVVNAGLPSVDPCELPGITEAKQGGSREKYYLTDQHQLCYRYHGQLKTSNGFWIEEGFGSPVWRLGSYLVGYKKTYIWKDTSLCVEGVKTNWIMNVYCVVNGAFVENELVMSHVYEASPDWDAKHKCPTFVQGRCSCIGKHRHEGMSAPSNTSFSSIARGSSSVHHGPNQSRDPTLNSQSVSQIMAMFEKVLFGVPEHDPDISIMETESCSPIRSVSPTCGRGILHKRKRISDVWDYFTKIYARDLKGTVSTLAACNHCSKVLTANSINGTRHLAHHTCPCKLKPVQAGRKDKGVVNVLSSQASSSCS